MARRTLENGLNDADKYDGMDTHPRPDTLECEVKWALGRFTRNRTSGSDGIPAELFKILKDNAVKSAELIISANFKNSAVAIGLEKISFHSNAKEGQCQRIFKVPHNCTHFAY